jgi:hypothetical protein
MLLTRPLQKVTDEDRWGWASGDCAEIIQERQAGRERTEKLLRCRNATLPYCSLIYEIVDKTDANYYCADLILRPSMRADVPMRTLYEYIEPCTPSSKSLVLYLYSSHSFREVLRPDNKIRLMCSLPASYGMRAHGVRILPPSNTRPLFRNPPTEVLSQIFGHAVEDKLYTRWRTTLVAFAKVCREWMPALDHLFKDFGDYSGGSNPPDITAVAKALQANPALGYAIRTFSPRHFRKEEDEELGDKTEASYLTSSEAIVQILQTARFATAVEVPATHKALIDNLVEALCVSGDVQVFVNGGYIPATAIGGYRCSLTLVDIFRCMTSWPRLSELKLYSFSGSNNDLHPKKYVMVIP